VISGSGLLCTRPYSEVGAVLEMTFNAFTTEGVFRLGQNDRADDLIACNLRSQKHFPFRKIRVGKFHELTASIHICPFIFHLHSRPIMAAMKSNAKTSAEFAKFLHFVRASMSVPGADLKAQIEREKEVRGKKKRPGSTLSLSDPQSPWRSAQRLG
jgi:hypothetical protein